MKEGDKVIRGDETMSLIDEVARLKELEEKDCHGSYHSDRAGFVYEVVMLNAAPALLDVLGEIQAGDADGIDIALEYLCDDPNDNNDPEIEIAKKVLRRYRDMATKMEAKSDG
jgi:hypothetical protein